jgi:hypothetical protein
MTRHARNIALGCNNTSFTVIALGFRGTAIQSIMFPHPATIFLGTGTGTSTGTGTCCTYNFDICNTCNISIGNTCKQYCQWTALDKVWTIFLSKKIEIF